MYTEIYLSKEFRYLNFQSIDICKSLSCWWINEPMDMPIKYYGKPTDPLVVENGWTLGPENLFHTLSSLKSNHMQIICSSHSFFFWLEFLSFRQNDNSHKPHKKTSPPLRKLKAWLAHIWCYKLFFSFVTYRHRPFFVSMPF